MAEAPGLLGLTSKSGHFSSVHGFGGVALKSSYPPDLFEGLFLKLAPLLSDCGLEGFSGGVLDSFETAADWSGAVTTGVDADGCLLCDTGS